MNTCSKCEELRAELSAIEDYLDFVKEFEYAEELAHEMKNKFFKKARRS